MAENLVEVRLACCAAEGYPLAEETMTALTGLITDPSSTFGPSTFRDLRAGRLVETSVFADLATRVRRHGISTPLLDANHVVIDVRARRT